MTQNENIVKLPDLLERRALRIDAALQRRAKGKAESDKGRTEWIEGTLQLAEELTAARDEYTNDAEFGKWFNERFDSTSKPLGDHERAALIHWGRDLTQARALMEGSDSWSVQMLHTKFVPTKTRRTAPPKPDTTPARVEAKEVIRAYKAEHGVYPSVAEAGKVTGKSRIVIEPALAAVVAEDKVAPASTPTYTKAQDHQFEARLKVLDRQRETTFEARVQAEYQKRVALMFPDLQKVQDEAVLNEQLYRDLIKKKAALTVAEYMDIFKTCHPDNSAGKEVRERAFIALTEKRLQLTGSK